MLITLDSLLARFPHRKIKANGEINTPCPFCAEQGVVYQGVNFAGDDRLVWFNPRSVVWCRHCGTHSYEELRDKLFDGAGDLDIELVSAPVGEIQKTHPVLADEEYVAYLHSRVQRPYWRAFGWSDEVIDQFKLGWGLLYPNSKRAERHIIPFKLTDMTDGRTLDGYALEGRLPPNSTAQESRNVKTAGVTRQYIWQMLGDDDTALIAEGVKDGISAYRRFRSVFAFFGAATDLGALGDYVSAMTFKKIVIATDNDPAGVRYRETLAKRLKAQFLFYVKFPETAPLGYDLTDLLRDQLDIQLERFEPKLERGFFPDYRAFDPDYRPSVYPAVDLRAVRDALSASVGDYMRRVVDRDPTVYGRGLLLAAPPGSGKSYALVRAAEEVGVEAKLGYDSALAALQAQLEGAVLDEAKAALQRQIENLSANTVLYAGLYISGWGDILHHAARPDLWYNFEARNPTNCENYRTVTEYAGRGYNASAFCLSLCPFYASCLKNGYQAQKRKMKQYPLVYVRHQNLIQEELAGAFRIVLVDESPLSVFEEPFVIGADDLRPSYDSWSAHAHPSKAEALVRLVKAVKTAVAENQTGRDFYRTVDVELRGALGDTLALLDDETLALYQPDLIDPDQVNRIFDLPKKCVKRLVEVMKGEIAAYEAGGAFNSRLSVKRRKLRLLLSNLPHIPKTRGVIVSDGTADPLLYKAVFRRSFSIVNPQFVNPDSKTVVYYGSDFTRSWINAQAGSMIKDFLRWNDEDEQLFNFDPVGESFYGSTALARAFQFIETKVKQHDKTLVVCYKDIRALFERRFELMHPDLARRVVWGHYGALRGTNRYEDCDAVVLIGCPRQPYEDIYERASAYGALLELPYIKPDLAVVPAPYDGRYEGAVIPQFADPFARRLVDLVEVGEVVQALERIRLHTSSKPKTAYLAMTRPAARFVTDVQPLSSVLIGKYQRVIDYIIAVKAEQNRTPTYRELQEKFNLSSKTIARIVRGMKDEKRYPL